MEAGRLREAEHGLGACMGEQLARDGLASVSAPGWLWPAQGLARKGMAKQGGTTKVARSRPCPVSEPAGRERFFVAMPKGKEELPL